MNLLTTLSNSLMQGFFPKGWDLAKIDGLAEVSGSDLLSKRAGGTLNSSQSLVKV